MNHSELTCREMQEITQDETGQSLALKPKKFELNELKPEECCSVKVPFHALKPGKYSIQAEFTYNQGKVEPIIVTTEVEPKIEAELNIGVIMLAYTLTRLSLNFTLSLPNYSD